MAEHSSSSNKIRPAPAKLKHRTEFSITLFVPTTPTSSTDGDAASWYRYEYKEAGTQWATSARHVDTKPGATEVLLDDLNPTSSYEIRIYAVTKDNATGEEVLSTPSEIAAVDTEVPGCTPDKKCVVM